MPSPATLSLLSSPFSLPTSWCQLTLALLLGGAAAQAQTPFGKNDSGTYLFQANNTKGYNLNFTTGSTTSQGDNNGQGGSVYVPSPGGTPAKLNAAGFNYADGYIWTQYNGTNQLVCVGTEFVGKAYSFTQPAGYTQTTFTVGDVDVTGKMYMTRGGSDEGSSKTTTDVYIIDLMQKANSLDVNPLVATELTFPYRSYITDWAFSPKDTCIYAINTYFNNNTLTNNENSTKIYRFVTHRRKFNGVVSEAGTRETLGVATGGSTPIAPANFAAAFMDANGSFYVVASGSGLAHRIDRPDLLPAVADASGASTSIPATYIGKFTSGIDLNTDGARNAFSRPVSGALPVQLLAFSATAVPSRSVRLDWATASEVNNDYFEVQRSPDGRSFEVAGRVRGHGSSLQTHAYSFVDAAPGAAATHYYRLRQVDHDGTSSFSPVQVVALGLGTSAFQLAAAPNPTTAGNLRVQVQYAGPAATPAVLTMRNLLGQTVLAQPVTLQPGTTTLAPAAPLAPGVYWLSLSGQATPGAQGTKVLITN